MTLVESLSQRVENLERYVQTLESRMHRNVNPHGFLQQPVRLAKTVSSGGSYPSDPATTYPILFLDGTFTESAGNGSATYTNRSSAAKRVGFALSSDYIPQNTIVTVFQQNGRYWITPSSATPSEGGDGERTLVVAEFSGTTPDTSISPNDSPKAIDWANANVSGSASSITFDATDDSCTYDVGEYMLTANVGVDNDTADHNSSGTFYAAGHASEGHWKVGALLVRFERWNGSSWDPESNGGYAYPGPDNFHQTVTFHQKLVVESPATEAKIRLAILHPSSDSSDATMRVFHALWMSEPITA